MGDHTETTLISVVYCFFLPLCEILIVKPLNLVMYSHIVCCIDVSTVQGCPERKRLIKHDNPIGVVYTKPEIPDS